MFNSKLQIYYFSMIKHKEKGQKAKIKSFFPLIFLHIQVFCYLCYIKSMKGVI